MINNYIIDYSLSYKIETKKMLKYSFFPITKKELFVSIAIANQTRVATKYIQELFNAPIKFINTTQDDIISQLNELSIRRSIFLLKQNAMTNTNQYDSENSYIIKMSEEIMAFAIFLKSSDIHIETMEFTLGVRFRIDGELTLIFTFEQELYPLLSSIIKLFASLDISQTRLPQNGRFAKSINNFIYDFRVSTIPIMNGESIVMRILDNKNANIQLEDVGLDDAIYDQLKEIIHSNQGMILVTGPTGSGKTTTLYAILNTLNKISKKIITIEDPVEYNLKGIQQININEDIGLTYTMSLKNILRQDPDIILIGEIRDEIALRIAIQASLTGHLVLATLHTNNAFDTINRLFDLNAEPFLVSATLKAVLSQRLVRKLSNISNKEYDGRIVVSEFLKVDKAIQNQIAKRTNTQDIIKYAKTKGFVSIEESGLTKVNDNITTIEEYYSKIKHKD